MGIHLLLGDRLVWSDRLGFRLLDWLTRGGRLALLDPCLFFADWLAVSVTVLNDLRFIDLLYFV